MRRGLLILLVPALLAVSGGQFARGAAAARLTWSETAKDGKIPIMSFRIDSLSFGKGTWSARVTITNLSKSSIGIGNQFGAAIYDNGSAENLSRAIGFADALTFSPARPATLRPGASWSGTIGGSGELESSGAVRYARLVFGPLKGLPGQSKPVFWVTDHRLVLPPSGSADQPGGPVI